MRRIRQFRKAWRQRHTGKAEQYTELSKKQNNASVFRMRMEAEQK